MFIEVGPASVVITGERAGVACIFDEGRLRTLLEAILSDIREWLPVLRQKAGRIRKTSAMPDVARRMVEAAKAVNEERLTPMAAVAGAVADVVKESVRHLEGQADSLFVNNGGDIAVFSRGGRPVLIGLGDIERQRPAGCRITVKGLEDFGTATSGWGGRSLTQGIADIVTVVAASGALADAAATDICNATLIESDRIERKKAVLVDEATDIPEDLVTVSVGPLRRKHIAEALENGLARAEALKKRGLIIGSVLVLRDKTVHTGEGENLHV